MIKQKTNISNFLSGVKYDQQVKTKTKQTSVEIVRADDFFQYTHQFIAPLKLEQQQ